jgi:hypothetical protein
VNGTDFFPASPTGNGRAIDQRLIDCRRHGLPDAIGEELCRLYGNIHSSPAHLRVYGGLDTVTQAYVATHEGGARAIFLLREEGPRLRVVNEGMRVDTAAAEAFARFVFATAPGIAAIEFHAIESAPLSLSFPLQQAVCTAEMPLALPSTVDAYIAGLGKNTRRNLRRYMDKLLQRFPSFRFDVHERNALGTADARAVIALNRARINGKQQAYSIDDEEERILALLQECGLAGVGRIDGKICCGALGYRVGDRFFFKIIGHDPQYNPWSLGILCCFLMIRACIERGCSEYNFMWNEYEYKFALGARRRELARVVIYRSRLHMLANGRMACAVARDAARHRAASLLEMGGRLHELPAATRAAFHLLHAARSLKRGLSAWRSA